MPRLGTTLTAFRLAVIAAGAASSAGEADTLVTAMRRAPSGQPPAAVTEVLGALEGSDAGFFTVGCWPDHRGALLSVEFPEIGVLSALLMLARDHGLAVYDIALKRLYDPTGSDDVDVEVVAGGVRLPFLTRELLSQLVAEPTWPEPEAPFVIVDRADQDFIQVWCHDDGTYQLEYREGGPESHFRSCIADRGVVIDAMWAWTIQDQRWHTAVDWMFVDVEAEARGVEPSHRSRDSDATQKKCG